MCYNSSRNVLKQTANLKGGCKIDVLWVKEKFTYAYKDGTVEL